MTSLICLLMITLFHLCASSDMPNCNAMSSCDTICISQSSSISSYSGFEVYRKKICGGFTYEEVQNDSTLYSFPNECTLCNIAVFWCVAKTNNALNYGTDNDDDISIMWQLTSNSLSGTMELCLCTYLGDNKIKSYYYNNEGVYQCIQSYDGSNSTLQFTHSVYNSNEICPTQSSLIAVTQTSCLTSTIHLPKNCSTVYLMPNSSYSSTATLPHYTGIGLLVATNLLTIIALISSCVYIFCQRKKSKFVVTENEQISLQNTSPQTEATSHNIETSLTSNNNTNITSGTNIYSSVEDEVDHNHHHHHRPPVRVASQYEVPLDLLQQAHVPLPPPPPLYATLDDQHDLTLPNPEYITNTAVTAPNPGYITNIVPKANPGYSSTAIKEEGERGERGEGERREELDYSYATVNKFLKKPTEDTEYNKLQHE